MHHHAGRLVDRGHHVVEEEKLERNLFGRRPGSRRLWDVEAHERAGLELHGGPGHDTVDAHGPLFDRSGKKRTALIRDHPSQEDVEPEAGRLGCDHERRLVAG
jgi:hypothetical protein